MIQLNKNTSRKDNLIFDVGLHKGEDTEFYLKKGFEVIAFEADPDLIEENKKKFSVEIIEKKLIIIEGAIVEDPSTQKVKFYKNLDKTTWGTVNQSWASRNEKLGTQNKLIEVNTIDFSKCIETYGIPYYIKIDIEGADLVCLKAFRQFKLKPYYLSIESEKVVFEKLIQELEILIDLGYDKFTTVQQVNMKDTKVPNPPMEGDFVSHIFSQGSSGLFGKDLQENWMGKDDILKEYDKIFSNYKKYGDSTFWQQNIFAKSLLRIISTMIGKPIPGWYDTHAKHSSCDN